MKIIHSLHVQAVTFASKDPEKLAGFYQQAFNIPAAKWIGKDHLFIQLDNLYLGFDRIKKDSDHAPGGAVIWFYVNNVEEVFHDLVAQGARIRSEVTRDERPGQALAVLYDPDGNMVGLMGPSVPPREE